MTCAFPKVAGASLLLALCAGSATIVTAQTAAPQPPAAPARDAAKQKPATGVIKGRVLSADGRPLRRAQVRVTAAVLRDARTASTDTEGNYELTDLPEGRYTVRVSRSGYLSLLYGQKYPGELGTTVALLPAETVSNVNVALPRAGIIAGRVLDEVGDPIAGVTMMAMQHRYFEGRRRVVPSGSTTRSDDTGQYRLIGLSPGEYYVLGTLRESWVVGGKDKTVLSFAPTYYPNATSLALAQRVKVGIGTEVTAVDFSLAIGRAANVSGVAFGASGGPMVGGRVLLSQEFRGPEGMSMMSAGSTTAGSDGKWRLTNVPPGEYKIELRSAAATSSERATQPLIVDSIDIEELTLAASAGGTIAGQVVLESQAGSALSLDRLRLTSRPIEGPAPAVPIGQQNGAVDAEGRFQLEGIAGAQRLNVGGIPDGWALKRIDRDGQDLTDAVLQLRSGERVDDVRVVLTDWLTTLTGTVLGEKESPSASGTIVVFADDPARWGEASRHVRGVRPTQTGEFEIKGLPAGDYRAIALEFIPDGDWYDPEVLQTLRDRALRFSLEEAERRTIALKLAK